MTTLIEANQFTSLSPAIPYLPPVVIFFSFLDKRSFAWVTQHKIVESLRHALPAGTEVSRYHTSFDPFGWGSGEILTHSWAVAVNLKYDDKVIEPLFVAIQEKKEVSDLGGIREVFDKVGCSKTQFDQEWGKEAVLKEKAWMDEVCRRVGVERLPAIVVTGKYLVNVDDIENTEDFGQRVQAVVKALLKQE
jgi:protein dithiol oxidoreductase (disulfide-forming)